MTEGAPPATTAAGDGAVEIGVFRATWDAVWGLGLDYHPRVDGPVGNVTLTTTEMLAEMGASGKSWDKVAVDEKQLSLARQSLDEVKAQTEYQDQKATRLLTVTTFLSAFSGLLFTRFIDGYPLADLGQLPCWQIVLILLAYAAFAMFVLAAVCGAIVTFHATRTRFKYSDIREPAKNAAVDGYPKSRLFYGPILGVRPRAWIESFVETSEQQGADPKLTVHSEINLRYFRDLVTETYLVAAKTADKLRYLGPAQSLLAGSLRFLLGWLVVAAIASVAIPPTRRPPAPSEVRLVAPAAEVPVRIKGRPSQPLIEVRRPAPPPRADNAETKAKSGARERNRTQ